MSSPASDSSLPPPPYGDDSKSKVVPMITDLTRFGLFVKENELNQEIANKLYEVLSNCEVVLLCDDSNSMGKAIAEEGTDAFGPKRSTRWLELKKLAVSIIQIVTAINPNGLDIYFLNRPKLTNVTNTAGLQSVFSIPPDGDTRLTAAIQQIYADKYATINKKQLLIVVITDGEPTGTPDPRGDLFNTLVSITQRGNVHVSFAECTDNAEDMEYLDQWDNLIKNFDNTDDYREELNRVKSVQGLQFKFDYMDYVIKILLATFVKWYFNLDQVRVADTRNTGITAYTAPTFSYQSTTYSYPQSSAPTPSYQPTNNSYPQSSAPTSTYQPTTNTYQSAPQPTIAQLPPPAVQGCGCAIL